MKKIIVTALILLLVLSAFACSNTASPTQGSASPSSSSGVGAQAAISASPSASASATKAGNVSPTTGLPGNTEYRPIQVQIDNETTTGRPQYGIQSADVVYEMMIEGVDTRLSAIFNDTFPTKVGPVRSSRVYFQYIQNEWDSIYVHDGGANNPAFPKSYVGLADNGGDMKKNIDAGKGQPQKIMWGGGKQPTWANLQEVENAYKYTQTQRSPMFKFDQSVDYSKYPGFSKVDLPFTGSGDKQVEYTYDKSSDLLSRYNFGEPIVDGATNKQVYVQNLIVGYVTDEIITPYEVGHRLEGVIGNGKAEFFVGGKHMTGTWKKTDRHAGTVYKLDDGSDLVLKPGNTWIAMQPNSKNILVTSDDSAAGASASAKK